MLKLNFIIVVCLYVKIVFSLEVGETIHYTWIGPPPEANPLHSIIGHDYIGPVLTARQLQNQESKTGIKHEIRFYCLDAFKQHYVELFKEEKVDIKVFGIIEFLLSFQNAENQMLQKLSQLFITYIIRDHNNQRQKLESTLLNYEQVEINQKNRKLDVALKDKFTLFLLASGQGYIFDTNIVPVGEVILKSYTYYLIPHIPVKAAKDPFNEKPEFERDLLIILRSLDCFALYAPPGDKKYALLAFRQIFSEVKRLGGRALNDAFRNKITVVESKYEFLNLTKFGLFKFSFETHREHKCRFDKNYNMPLSKNKAIFHITTLQNTKIDSAKKEFWDIHKNCCRGEICQCEIIIDKIYDKEFPVNYIIASVLKHKKIIYKDTEILNHIKMAHHMKTNGNITAERFMTLYLSEHFIKTEEQESLLETEPNEEQTWNTFLIRKFLEEEENKDKYYLEQRTVTPITPILIIESSDGADEIDYDKWKQKNSYLEWYYQVQPGVEEL